MKPPSIRPSSARVKKNVLRPVKRDWQDATIDQHIIWIGIQLSGPSFLDIICDGSSAHRKER